eukprot:6010725-Pyramimonas_sp.AAC.1
MRSPTPCTIGSCAPKTAQGRGDFRDSEGGFTAGNAGAIVRGGGFVAKGVWLSVGVNAREP